MQLSERFQYLLIYQAAARMTVEEKLGMDNVIRIIPVFKREQPFCHCTGHAIVVVQDIPVARIAVTVIVNNSVKAEVFDHAAVEVIPDPLSFCGSRLFPLVNVREPHFLVEGGSTAVVRIQPILGI